MRFMCSQPTVRDAAAVLDRMLARLRAMRWWLVPGSVKNLVDLVGELHKQGVQFKSLTDAIDTGTASDASSSTAWQAWLRWNASSPSSELELDSKLPASSAARAVAKADDRQQNQISQEAARQRGVTKRCSRQSRRFRADALSMDSSLHSALTYDMVRFLRGPLLGRERGAYGEQIVVTASRQLVALYGRGYAEKNLRRMAQFAEAFPEEQIVVTLSRQLSWSHFSRAVASELKPFQREFYAEMCRIEGLECTRPYANALILCFTAHGAVETARCLIRQELASAEPWRRDSRRWF